MQEPLFSVITPSYNQANFLDETIRSVLDQDYPHIEFIVMDGGSSDGSQDVLKKYEGRLFWKSERDKGQSDAINKGWKIAKGDIISYLNSDDTYLPGAFRSVANFFKDHPDVMLVYGDCYFIDENSKVIGSYPTEKFDLKRLLNVHDFIPQQSAFFRREMFAEIGFLDPELHMSMDYDYWLRIGKRFKVAYMPGYLANFRRHEEAKTSQKAARHWMETLAVSRKHGGDRFSRLYYRYLTHSVYNLLPKSLRRLAKEPMLEKIAKVLR